MQYQRFLEYVREHIFSARISETWEEFETKPLYQYLVSCFQEHAEGIEVILSLGYTPEKYFLREMLSGDFPMIEIHDSIRFEESLASGKSDFIPVVIFKKTWVKNILMEFAKAGLPF